MNFVPVLALLLTVTIGSSTTKADALVLPTMNDLETILSPAWDKISQVIDQVIKVVADTSAQVKNIIQYTFSTDFLTKLQALTQSPAFAKLNQQLQPLGIDVQRVLNIAFSLLGVPPTTSTTPPTTSTTRASFKLPTLPPLRLTRDVSSTVGTFLDTVFNLIPTSLLGTATNIYYLISSDFRTFVKTVTSADFLTALNAVLSSPEAAALINDAKKHGVDADAIMAFVKQLGTDVYAILKDVQSGLPQ